MSQYNSMKVTVLLVIMNHAPFPTTLVVHWHLAAFDWALILQDGEKMLQANHYASEIIQIRLAEMEELWEELQEKCDEKGKKLQDAYKVISSL